MLQICLKHLALQPFIKHQSNFMKKSIIILSIFLFCQIANAQMFSSEKLQNKANVDKKQFSWGYYLGYNSLDFKNYKKESRSNENSLNSSFVHTLYQDENNNIWAGTQKGLNVYDRNIDKFSSINLNNDKNTYQSNVYDLVINNDEISIEMRPDIDKNLTHDWSTK